jgi:hypothetical protein
MREVDRVEPLHIPSSEHPGKGPGIVDHEDNSYSIKRGKREKEIYETSSI